MATVMLTVTPVVPAGIDFDVLKTLIVITDTYFFPNGGREKIWIDNASGFALNATFETPNTDADQNVVADKVIAIPTAKKRILGPFKPGVYNQNNGTVKVTFDQAVSVVVFTG